MLTRVSIICIFSFLVVTLFSPMLVLYIYRRASVMKRNIFYRPPSSPTDAVGSLIVHSADSALGLELRHVTTVNHSSLTQQSIHSFSLSCSAFRITCLYQPDRISPT